MVIATVRSAERGRLGEREVDHEGAAGGDYGAADAVRGDAASGGGEGRAGSDVHKEAGGIDADRGAGAHRLLRQHGAARGGDTRRHPGGEAVRGEEPGAALHLEHRQLFADPFGGHARPQGDDVVSVHGDPTR